MQFSKLVQMMIYLSKNHGLWKTYGNTCKFVFYKISNHYYYETFLEKCLCNSFMLYYNRNDISEGVDVNKTSTSKDCTVCHY